MPVAVIVVRAVVRAEIDVRETFGILIDMRLTPVVREHRRGCQRAPRKEQHRQQCQCEHNAEPSVHFLSPFYVNIGYTPFTL